MAKTEKTTSDVLFVSSEVFPLAKVGGLADVSASLPQALMKLGHKVHLLLPAYPSAMAKAASKRKKEPIAELIVQGYQVRVWQSVLPGTSLVLWLVDVPELFDRPGNPYQNPEGHDWPDNAQRFGLFARVAAMLALDRAGLNWQPEVVHCNDWQSALVPALLDGQPARPATVFTVHNLAYHGWFPYSTFQELALPMHFWSHERLEFHGQLAFIKGGLVYADRVTTVSPTYAEEIQTEAFGQGLDGLIRHRHDRLVGILNGIDEQEWNPARDPHIIRAYEADNLDGKVACKAALQESQGLEIQPDAPLAGFIGRLVDQKGVDLIVEVLPGLLDSGCQVAMLGSGSPELEAVIAEVAARYPGRMSVFIGYDEGLAHRITAGADIFLMPSRFEPCGLNQMYSLHYGTLPVVHAVGGLRDTVFDETTTTSAQANGFSFEPATAAALWSALARCLECYGNKKHWKTLQRNAMEQDFSWDRSARAYSDVYSLAREDRASQI
ncbi:MAG: glycogen synthase GlgA [Oleiphilaceae bacterium]|nr:glycogen synthase GlgA [Oleiphilaceae bacterium]